MKPLRYIAPLALAATMACTHAKKEPVEHQVNADAIRQVRGEVDRLTNRSFDAMVPDDRVRKMAQNFFARPFDLESKSKTLTADQGARSEILNDELYGKLPKVARHCYPNCDTMVGSKELNDIIRSGRSMIIDKAKQHLSNPENLEAFYKAKKPFIIDGIRKSLEAATIEDERIRKLIKEERIRQLKKWMEGLRKAITTLYKPEFKEAYENYLENEEALLKEKPEFAGRYGGVSENVRSGYRKEVDTKDRAEIPAYANFRDAEEKLRALTPDLDASLFAARRKKENPAILKTYLKIIADLEKEAGKL